MGGNELMIFDVYKPADSLPKKMRKWSGDKLFKFTVVGNKCYNTRFKTTLVFLSVTSATLY